MAKKALWSAALASGLTLIGSISGLASVAVVPVSSEPSPLAGCSNLGQPGVVYNSGEEEPSLAVFGSKMIGMWHQDRWNNGGAHGIGVGYSTNGGTSWTQTVLPDDKCSAPVVTTDSSLSFYQRSSDPWVSFGPDGTAYASALSFDGSDNKNAVAAGSSTDGGQTWTMTAIKGSIFTSIDQSTDKNSTTADPIHAGTAYTVWDTLFTPTDHNPDDNPHPSAYTGPAYFSKTTDGGATWSDAKVIINTAERQQTIGNIIVVGPDDTLYDFTDLLVSPNTSLGQGTNGNAEIAFVKSPDGGKTWTQPQVIAPFNSLGVTDPLNPQLFLRVGNGLEEVAIGPAGRLYVVWESSSNFEKNTKQSSGLWDNEILLVSSSDGGAHWSTPTSVDHHNNGMPAYTPTVAVNSSGVVAVTYYDDRNLGTNPAFMGTDYWVNFSTDGGATFNDEQRITSTSFDQLSAPNARGFFLGDYEGLQASGASFEALFVTTNCSAPYLGSACGPASSQGTNGVSTPNTNPTDVFAATVSP